MAIVDAWINHWFIGIERYNVLVMSYKIIRKEKKKGGGKDDTSFVTLKKQGTKPR